MLQTGGGAGNLRIGHGQTGEDQSLHRGLYRVRVPILQLRSHRHDARQRLAHQRRDVRAVIFVRHQMGNTPLAQGHILGQHIAQTGLQHPHGSKTDNVRVRNDSGGTGVIQADLNTVLDHGGAVRGIAVHAGGGAEDHAATAHGMSQHLAAVVDHAGTDAEDHVTAGVKGHQTGAHGILVWLHMLHGEYELLIGEIRGGKDGLRLRPRGGLRMLIADNKGLGAAGGLQRVHKVLHRAGADLQIFQAAAMMPAARTVEAARVNQLFQGLIQNIHKSLSFPPNRGRPVLLASL